MSDIPSSFRLTLRSLRRAPVYATVSLLSLALGIGSVTTMFSVVDAVDLRPLPFPSAERLVMLQEIAPNGSPDCGGVFGCRTGTSTLMASEWRQQSPSLEAVGVLGYYPRRLISGDVSESLRSADVSASLFNVLRTPAALGRALVPSDEQSGSEPVVVLSHALWMRAFAGDRGILGRRLVLRDEFMQRETPYTVVGVMPTSFGLLSTEIWTPLKADGMLAPTHRDRRFALALGRLAPHHTLAAATVEAQTLAARLAAANPETNTGWSATIIPFTGSLEVQFFQLGGAGFTAGLSRFLLLAIVSVVLLVATLNVAILSALRTHQREGELAVRRALGASAGQLARQIGSEVVCLALGGGVLGILLAFVGVGAVARGLQLDRVGIPIAVDGRVLFMAMVLTGISALIAGTIPALWSARRSALGALRAAAAGAGGQSGARRSRAALVVAEIAGALMLLTTAGMLSREFVSLRYRAAGFDAQDLYAADVAAPRAASLTLAEQLRFLERGRTSVATAVGVPAIATQANDIVPVTEVSGRAAGTPVPRMAGARVSGNYFATLRVPVRRGRSFSLEDREGNTPVVIVDSLAALMLWPGLDPIGQRLTFSDSATGRTIATVVGVVGTVRDASQLSSTLLLPPVAHTYRPLAQAPAPTARLAATLFFRSSRPAGQVLPSLRRTIFQLSEAPVDPRTVRAESARLSDELRQQRFSATSLGIFAFFGLSLSALGFFGVVASDAARRRRELAIRLALGATPKRVVQRFVARSVAVCAIGVAIGLAGSFALTRVMRATLVSTAAVDPWVFGGSTLLLTAVAIVASGIPAWRTARAMPASMLRSE